MSNNLNPRLITLISNLCSRGLEGYDSRTDTAHNLGGVRGWIESHTRVNTPASKIEINRPELLEAMKTFNAPLITMNQVEVDDDGQPILKEDESTGEERHNRINSCMMLYIRANIEIPAAVARLKEMFPDVAEHDAIVPLTDIIQEIPQAEILSKVSLIKGSTGMIPTDPKRLVFFMCPSGSKENNCLWSNRKRASTTESTVGKRPSGQNILDALRNPSSQA